MMRFPLIRSGRPNRVPPLFLLLLLACAAMGTSVRNSEVQSAQASSPRMTRPSWQAVAAVPIPTVEAARLHLPRAAATSPQLGRATPSKGVAAKRQAADRAKKQEETRKRRRRLYGVAMEEAATRHFKLSEHLTFLELKPVSSPKLKQYEEMIKEFVASSGLVDWQKILVGTLNVKLNRLLNHIFKNGSSRTAVNTLVFNPSQRPERSKTGSSDETAAPDDSKCHQIGIAIMGLRSAKGKQEDLVFGRLPLEQAFRSAAKCLGYDHVEVKRVHQFRHGGASQEALGKTRPAFGIQRRLRVSQARIFRCSEDGGRLNEVFTRSHQVEEKHAPDAEESIGKILCGGCPPLRPLKGL